MNRYILGDLETPYRFTLLVENILPFCNVPRKYLRFDIFRYDLSQAIIEALNEIRKLDKEIEKLGLKNSSHSNVIWNNIILEYDDQSECLLNISMKMEIIYEILMCGYENLSDTDWDFSGPVLFKHCYKYYVSTK